MGVAATIPSAVRSFPRDVSCIDLHVVYNTGWYLGQCISSIANEIARLLCFRRGCPHWSSSWPRHRRCLDWGIQVCGPCTILLYPLMRSLHRQTWRANFYFATGLGALSMVLGMLSIDSDIPSTETDRRCDWLGALLVTAGFVLIVFVLSDGEIVGWSTSCNSRHHVICLQCTETLFLSDIICLLVIGISCIVLFVFWEYHLEQVQRDPTAIYSIWTPPPLMKPSIWTRANGRFAVMMAIIFLNWCAFLRWDQITISSAVAYMALKLVSLGSGQCLPCKTYDAVAKYSVYLAVLSRIFTPVTITCHAPTHPNGILGHSL